MIKRIGVLGTLVWDRIWHPSDSARGPREQWGGIAYSLAAMAAACPPTWRIVPLVRVGADLAGPAFEFFGSLPAMATSGGPVVVPEENNRVELRYVNEHEREERLSGGVSAWTWDELARAAGDLDALYVNFISGYEMDLATAERLRELQMPIYADLHSLFLGEASGGARPPRRPQDLERWIACFDAVQMNEREFELATGNADGFDRIQAITALGPLLAVVTRGPGGVHYARRMGWSAPRDWPALRGRPQPVEKSAGTVQSGFVPAPAQADGGDPTGCGDVWGAVFFAGLLSGLELEAALRRANEAAARKLRCPSIGDLRTDLAKFLGKSRMVAGSS